ncbi:energy transducer TonB [Geothrix limicola]|nr:energy transducer TonB [Geothrix limicola]
MDSKPKYRMGRGEKVFLWGVGILAGLVVAVALPALLHQRERTQAKAAQEEAARQAQPPMPSLAQSSPAPVPVQTDPSPNGEVHPQHLGGTDMNDHCEGIPQGMIPLVPITSLVEILPRPELVYPAEAQAKKIQGKIQVEVTISTAGIPVTAVSQNGPIVLRIAAENWQLKRRFKPPVFEGLVQPVKVVNNVTFAIQ